MSYCEAVLTHHLDIDYRPERPKREVATLADLLELTARHGLDASTEPFDVLDLPLDRIFVVLDVLGVPVLFEVGANRLIRHEIVLDRVDVQSVTLEAASHPRPLGCRDVVGQEPVDILKFPV